MESTADFILAPGARLMRHLKLPAKLVLLGVVVLVPLLLLAANFSQRFMADASFTRDEIAGAHLVDATLDVLLATQRHRDLALIAQVDPSQASRLQDARGAMLGAMQSVDAVLARGDTLKLGNAWAAIRAPLDRLATEAGNATTISQTHDAQIAALREFVLLIGERSGLLLDPEAPTFFLMSLVVQRSVPWIDQLARLYAHGTVTLTAARADAMARAEALGHIEALQGSIEELRYALAGLERSGEAVPDGTREAIDASMAYIESARAAFGKEARASDPRMFAQAGEQSIDKAHAFLGAASTRMLILLDARSATLTRDAIVAGTATVLGIALVIYLMVAFSHSFVGALRAVHEAVASVARGDLARRVEVPGRDEMAAMAKELDDMTGALSAIVADIRAGAQAVARTGEDLSAEAQNLSDRTEQQAASLEETAAGIEELTSTVQSNAQSARSVNTLTSEVRGIADSGDGTMNAAVASMQGIQSSARRVQDIIGVIDGIAFQTNILALNAAVEAARAGEAGRGFAVVASEVRTLAQRSGKAAHEIRDLIGDSGAQVDTGVAHIAQVSKTLADISRGVRAVADDVNAISNASVEQSNGLSQIADAISELDAITQQNAQMVDATTHALGDLRDRATQLAARVEQFRLRDA